MTGYVIIFRSPYIVNFGEPITIDSMTYLTQNIQMSGVEIQANALRNSTFGIKFEGDSITPTYAPNIAVSPKAPTGGAGIVNFDTGISYHYTSSSIIQNNRTVGCITSLDTLNNLNLIAQNNTSQP